MIYTDDELRAMQSYASDYVDYPANAAVPQISHATHINSQLRQGKVAGQFTHPEQNETAKHLNTATLKKQWPWVAEPVLYRGQNTLLGISNVVGATFTVDTYWSATTVETATHRFVRADSNFGPGAKGTIPKVDVALMALTFPKPQHAIDMMEGNITMNEREVLLPPGLTWKVIAASVISPGYNVWIEETSIVHSLHIELV